MLYFIKKDTFAEVYPVRITGIDGNYFKGVLMLEPQEAIGFIKMI